LVNTRITCYEFNSRGPYRVNELFVFDESNVKLTGICKLRLCLEKKNQDEDQLVYFNGTCRETCSSCEHEVYDGMRYSRGDKQFVIGRTRENPALIVSCVPFDEALECNPHLTSETSSLRPSTCKDLDQRCSSVLRLCIPFRRATGKRNNG